MSFRRHDSLTTRLGERSGRNLWRLWVEDTGYARLARNNFAPGCGFEVARRPGTGLIIQSSLVASCHVSSRRSVGVLSYEAKDLGEFLGTPEVRVRIQVGCITVTPLLRFHSIASVATETWSIVGDVIRTPSGTVALRSVRPLRLHGNVATIEVALDESNLVYATELIGNHRPGRVLLRGSPILVGVASKFLTAGGYSGTDQIGEFRR